MRSITKFIIMAFYVNDCALWHQIKGGIMRRELVFLLKRINWGLLIVGGLIFDRHAGNPNISILLQLVVNIV